MIWRSKHMMLIAFATFTITRQDDGSTESYTSIETSTSTAANERQILAQHINDFGLKIMKKMVETADGKNVVLSPTSVTGLLAMALLGSVGDTYNELVQAFGFSADALENLHHHELFGEMLGSLKANNETKTTYANGIFVWEKLKLRPLYKDYVESVYRASVAEVDFEKQMETLAFINNWAKEHTNNKITSFLQKPLKADTNLVLMSALYFSGQWKKPFTPEFTRNMTFHKQDGTTVEANLMLNYGKFFYAYNQDLDAHMVAIPYRGEDTTMYVMKPRRPKHQNVTELIAKLNAEKIDALIEEMQNRTCVLRFPKMNIELRSDLRESLQALGIESMFTSRANFGLMINTTLLTEKANVSGLSDTLARLSNPGLSVDSIVHQVQMNINEFGTEAAAVTAGVLTRTAELFITDSPFFFFIRDEKTKLITFSSVIFDPTENLN